MEKNLYWQVGKEVWVNFPYIEGKCLSLKHHFKSSLNLIFFKGTLWFPKDILDLSVQFSEHVCWGQLSTLLQVCLAYFYCNIVILPSCIFYCNMSYSELLKLWCAMGWILFANLNHLEICGKSVKEVSDGGSQTPADGSVAVLSRPSFPKLGLSDID